MHIKHRRFPWAEFLGFELNFNEREECEITFRPKPEHFNPMGTLHGGIFCDLADAAMGLTRIGLLAEDETFTTLELKVNYLKPIWNSTLRAVPHIVKGGRTIGLLSCDVFDETGSLVAYATSTVMNLRGQDAKGR